MLPLFAGEGLQRPFSLREKGAGDEGQSSVRARSLIGLDKPPCCCVCLDNPLQSLAFVCNECYDYD